MHQTCFIFPKKSWHFKDAPEHEVVHNIAKELSVPYLLARLLAQRGFATPKKAFPFIYPSLDSIQNPLNFKDMDIATKRIGKAIFKKEPIGIFGDYDVDGICGTVLLASFFSHIGIRVFYKSPHRIKEGYGLSTEAFDQFSKHNVKLVTTVDCGSKDISEIEYAKSLGIEVIVLDHHEIQDILPNAVAIVNPKRKDCPSIEKEAAATAVTFYFALALSRELLSQGISKNRLPDPKNYLDLVALATLADQMPLIGDNRVFVKLGLKLLSNPKRPGIAALKQFALGSKNAVVLEREANFALIPRLNAAGRISTARKTVKMLLMEDFQEVLRLASEIEGFNKKRRVIQDKVFDLAKIEAEKMVLKNMPILIVAGKDWHQGVAGIVAARLVEEFGLPAIVLERLKNGLLRGSGRSIPGISLAELIESSKKYLKRFGGHAAACGLMLDERYLDDFIKSMALKLRGKNLHTSSNKCIMQKPPLYIDLEINRNIPFEDLFEAISFLSPFGQGNQRPTLLFRNCTISRVFPVKNNHLRLNIKANLTQGMGIYSQFRDRPIHQEFKAIGFGLNCVNNNINEGSSGDFVLSPQISTWNGTSRLDFILEDLSLK